MRLTINHERACATDSFTAVVVEHDRFLAFGDELVVQDVEHLEKRCFIGDLVDDVIFECTLRRWSGLTPDAQCDVFEMIAHL